MVSKQMLDLGFQIYCITIENTSNGDTRFFNVVDHTHELFGNWLHLANILYDKAVNSNSKDRKQSWFKWFTFQKKFITIVDVPLYNGHIFHKSLDYGYFLSVHKLQGSTIKNICIDMSDIYYPISKKGLELKNDLNTANRLMYVALSRATKYAIIKF
jgi:hypothetical protein